MFQCQAISGKGRKKSIVINEKPLTRALDLVGKFPVFMIAPRDILILLESSIERRKLMNRTISLSDADYLMALLKYNRILKQRNILLKSTKVFDSEITTLLESYDEQLVAPAEIIFYKRVSYISELNMLANDYYNIISNEQEEVTLQYNSQLTNISLINLMKENKLKDQITKKTNGGIHKDDIIISINGMPIKKYGSEGQLKSAIIAIKLAELEWIKKQTNIKPILLLDDIFDKLDSKRVSALIKLSNNNLASQVFITDTNRSRLDQILESEKISYQAIEIDKGRVI